MYNAELKQQYLSEMEHKNTNLRRLMEPQFDRIAKHEEALNKDCSNFTVEEIINYYKSLCYTSFETLMVISNQYKIYADYCLNRNLVKDNQNHFYEINYELIKNCINYGLMNEQIVTREELLHIISQLNNPSDRFLVLALFEGICGKNMCELCSISLTDFNQDGTVTLCTGRTLNVSTELYNLAKLCNETFEYYAYTKSGNEKVFPFDPNDTTLLKDLYNCSAAGNKRQRIYNKIVRMRNYLGANCISTSSLNESGRIHTILNICKTENKDFKDCLIEHKEVENVYGKIFSYSTYMLKYQDIIQRM